MAIMRGKKDSSLRRWTREETRMMDRYIEAVRAGEFKTVDQAARKLHRELVAHSASEGNLPIRSYVAVYRRLIPSLRNSGVSKTHARWSKTESRVFNRYVRALYAHRYSSVLKAAADCQRDLIELRQRVLARNPDRPAPFVRSFIAIRRRLADCTTGFPGEGRTRCLAADLTRILDRYARAVSTGRIPNVTAAARECNRELARPDPMTLRGRQRPETYAASWLRILIARRMAALGLPMLSRRWTRAEQAVLDRYARRVHKGEYESLTLPVRRIATELRWLRRRNPRQYAGLRPRTLNGVRDRLMLRIASQPHERTRSGARDIGGVRWRPEEERLIDCYARRLVARRYRSTRAAGAACWQCFRRLRRKARKSRRDERPANRTLDAVDRRLRLRAREISRYELPYRRWSDAEARVAWRWVRQYHQYRLGKSKMNRDTCADMMRRELDRRGFYRGLRACQAELGRGYNRLVRGRRVAPAKGKTK